MTYQEYMNLLQDKVISVLSKGMNPWQLSTGGDRAHNGITGRRYSGANGTLLNCISTLAYGGDKRWYTFNQAKKIGCSIRKGEKATPAYFFQNRIERPKRDQEGNVIKDENGLTVYESVKIPPVFKVYYVFNAQQLDPVPGKETVRDIDGEYNEELAQKILDESPVPINYCDIEVPFYRPSSDEISIPLKSSFPDEPEFYSTAFHEMAHSTGAISRLARPQGGIFGDPEYALEELVAELTALNLCDECDMKYTYKESAKYIGSWLMAISDPNFKLSSIYNQVTKASRYLSHPEDRKRLETQIRENSDELLLQNDNRYLHVQKSISGEEPFDYTIFDENLSELDGGRIGTPGMKISDAIDEISKLHNLDAATWTRVSLSLLEPDPYSLAQQLKDATEESSDKAETVVQILGKNGINLQKDDVLILPDGTPLLNDDKESQDTTQLQEVKNEVSDQLSLFEDLTPAQQVSSNKQTVKGKTRIYKNPVLSDISRFYSQDTGWSGKEQSPWTIKGAWDSFGFVDFLGTPVTGPKDIARMMSIYRNPRLEYFHIVLVKDGKVTRQLSMTSGLPGSVHVVPKEGLEAFGRKINKTDYDEAYLIHNHPSGNIEPSMPDVVSTLSYIDSVFQDKFKGHIILDHTKFTLLTSAKDSGRKGLYSEKIQHLPNIHQIQRPEVLGEIRSPLDIALFFQNQHTKGSCFIDLNSNMEIQGVTPFSLEDYNREEFLSQMIDSGISQRALITDDYEAYTKFVDVIRDSGRQQPFLDCVCLLKDGYRSMLSEDIIDKFNWGTITKERETRIWDEKASDHPKQGWLFEKEPEFYTKKDVLLTNGQSYVLIRKEDSGFSYAVFDSNLKRRLRSGRSDSDSLQGVMAQAVTPSGDTWKIADLNFTAIDVPDLGLMIDTGKGGLTYKSIHGGENYGKDYLRIFWINEDKCIIHNFTSSGKNAKNNHIFAENVFQGQFPSTILATLGYDPDDYEKIKPEEFFKKAESLDFNYWPSLGKPSFPSLMYSIGNVTRVLSLKEADDALANGTLQPGTPFSIKFIRNGKLEKISGTVTGKETGVFDYVTDADTKKYLEAMLQLDIREESLVIQSRAGTISEDSDYFHAMLDWIEEQRSNLSSGRPYNPEGFPKQVDFERIIRKETADREKLSTPPVVEFTSSEHPHIRCGKAYSLAEADSLLSKMEKNIVDSEHETFRTNFTIRFILDGQQKTYSGCYVIGKDAGSITDHIKASASAFLANKQLQEQIRQQKGAEELSKYIANKRTVLDKVVPSLLLHESLDEQEKRSDELLKSLTEKKPTEVEREFAAYSRALLDWVEEQRVNLNSGKIADLLNVPQLEDFQYIMPENSEKIRTVYLSGPITADPNYEANFKNAENALLSLGYNVLNPVELVKGKIAQNASAAETWRRAMEIDLEALRKSDAVIILDKNGLESTGMDIETHLASRLGIPLIAFEHVMTHNKGNKKTKTSSKEKTFELTL